MNETVFHDIVVNKKVDYPVENDIGSATNPVTVQLRSKDMLERRIREINHLPNPKPGSFQNLSHHGCKCTINFRILERYVK